MNLENLIWIEPFIENEEYDMYLEDIKSLSIPNIFKFKNTQEGITKILDIKFEYSLIIISGRIIDDFFPEFLNKIDDLNIIPRIIVFAESKKAYEILENKKKYKSYPFFKSKLVFDEFSDVKNEILKDNISDYFSSDKRFSFELIKTEEELSIIINYYKFVILAKPPKEEIRIFNKFLYDKFKSHFQIYQLLKNTFAYDIPEKLLIQYWLRLYSISDFQNFMNDNLQKGTSNEFGIYTQLLYIGLNNNLIQPYLNTKLYRGGIITKNELERIKSFKKKKMIFMDILVIQKYLFHLLLKKILL